MKLSFFNFAFLIAFAAHAGNALVTITDGARQPLVGVKCVVTAQNYPQPHTGGVAVQFRAPAWTDANGSFTLSNCVPSDYVVTAVGNNFVPFRFTMPATNGTITVQNWLVYAAPPNLSTNYPTFAQGDLRWGNQSSSSWTNLLPVWTSGPIQDQNAITNYYTVLNQCGENVFDAGVGFFSGENFIFTNWSGNTYLVQHAGTNCSIVAEQVFNNNSGLSLYTFNLALPASGTVWLVQQQVINLPLFTAIGGSNSIYLMSSGNNGIGIGINNMAPGINFQPFGAVDFNDPNGTHLLYIGNGYLGIGNGSGGDSSTLTTNGYFNGKVNSTNIIGGITTNLQFTFSSSRTNTLYFTNGILMRVTQP